MADIVLKTFKGGNVTPQDDAIIYQTAIPGAGIFKGCEVTIARSNVLHISQGFGMIKGRFFEVSENEISVKLADLGLMLKGRLYIHIDLSNSDNPIQINVETAETLSELSKDGNLNYNNGAYDLELATFKISSNSISELIQTFPMLQAGGGGQAGIQRETPYRLEDTGISVNSPKWCTFVCTQAGITATAEPSGYAQITKAGDKVLDGSCIFEARAVFRELDRLGLQYVGLDRKVAESIGGLSKSVDEILEQVKGAGKLVQKLISITDYKNLGTYDNHTIYYCYDNADTQEIKAIYIGEHVTYATGIAVVYQVDTENTIKKLGMLQDDIVASAPTVTKEGYEFVGWKSDRNADREVLKSYMLKSESAVTLYAVFKKQITISMDSGDAELINGKSETSQTAVVYYNNGTSLSEEVLMPQNVYEYGTGKSFCGWKTDMASDNVYAAGEKYKFTKDEELVPVFIDTEYDFLDVLSTYQLFRVPADGIYEFECWGGAGAECTGKITSGGSSSNITAKGGKGGHVKAYRKCKKGSCLYVFLGGKGNDTVGGRNGGSNGYNYTNGSYNNYGAGGGGATHIATELVELCYSKSPNDHIYKKRDKILLVAGGGGGGGITGVQSDGKDWPQPYKANTVNKGGYGGGERGEDGSGGNYGGRQVSIGKYDYSNFGGATYPDGGGPYRSISGGGGGWYGGNYGSSGNSGAGGSSYVGNMPTFTYKGKKYKTVNEADKNDGAGYAYIRFIEPCVVKEE